MGFPLPVLQKKSEIALKTFFEVMNKVLPSTGSTLSSKRIFFSARNFFTDVIVCAWREDGFHGENVD